MNTTRHGQCLVLLAIALFNASPGYCDESIGQTPSSGTVKVTSVQETSTVRWAVGAPSCSSIYKDGIKYKVPAMGNITVFYTTEDNANYNVVRLFIKNDSTNRIDVLPPNFSFVSQDGIVPPIDPAEFDSLYASKANSARRLAQWNHGNYVPGSGYTPGLSFVGTTAGSTTFIHQSSGGLLRRHLANQSAEKADSLLPLQQGILRANTIFPGASVSGYILCPKSTAQSVQQFQATIGGYRFIFDW